MGLFDFLMGKSKIGAVPASPECETKALQPRKQKLVGDEKKQPKKAQSTEGETVTDADGNVYNTVKIGSQLWTIENLRTTKFNDETPIPYVPKQSQWEGLTSPAYCWYRNEIHNKEKCGALYNWHTVRTGKLAPKGWHVPTEKEWLELERYLNANGFNWDGSNEGYHIAKAMAAKTDWAASENPGAVGNDLSKNNRSGFSALPGGFRDEDGSFRNQGDDGYWWCATDLDFFPSQACMRNVRCNISDRNTGSHNKCRGFSVRLVKD
jgi:uncharacterized protein (TIGR02145 family)